MPSGPNKMDNKFYVRLLIMQTSFDSKKLVTNDIN